LRYYSKSFKSKVEVINMEKIDFYCFSGTGNTLLVVKKMIEIFEKEDITTNLYRIEDSDPIKIDLNHIIGLAFPVSELSTYDFVWKFIKSLPVAQGTKIFMVDTLAGFSGGIVGSLRKILQNKGYETIGAKEIIMPPNIFYIEDEEISKKKIKKGLLEAEEYAISIINRESYWGRIPLLSDSVYYTSITALKLTHSNIHQKLLHLDVDKDKCNKCEQCIELCPINNIKTGDDDYPVYLRNCNYCQRCTSFCPRCAISAPFNYKGKTYRAVKAKEILKFKSESSLRPPEINSI
jgi:ferredoxin